MADAEGKGPDERGGEDAGADERARSAWRSWLSALATDAEAAMAAALAYESLPDEARDAWLDALDGDARGLQVPKLALYAPLLAVEPAGERRGRIEAAIASEPERGRARVVTALRGVARDGTHACAIVSPVYLDFVEVLVCRYTPGGGFVAAHHDPLRHAEEVAAMARALGVAVEPTPLGVVVEELAHAVLADKREQRETPKALASFARLFSVASPPDAT